MKKFKIFILISAFLLLFNFSFAYEKLDFFDSFHIYTPYIYIIQDDTIIEKVKILVLFHDYEDVENENGNKKKKKEKDDKKKDKKDKKSDKNVNIVKDNEVNKNNDDNIEEENNDITSDEINKDIFDFVKEAKNWEFRAEKEKFFLMGLDAGTKKTFFNRTKMDILNKRILFEIERIKDTCETKEVKVYVAGTRVGGDIALLFNLIYDNYDGALCMNISTPFPETEKYFENCKDKKFYFFHCGKNKEMSVKKVNKLKKKLIKKGAIAETIIYNDLEEPLPYSAYSQAIDKITTE